MKCIKLICIAVVMVLLASCAKSISQKELKRREGKWQVVEIHLGDNVIIDESDNFGSIEFFDDGTGEFRIKNLDYSDEDMGLVISFYLKSDVSGTPGKFLTIQGLYLSETKYGYEHLIGQELGENGEWTMNFETGFFPGKRRKNAVCSIGSLGSSGGSKWHLKLVK